MNLVIPRGPFAWPSPNVSGREPPTRTGTRPNTSHLSTGEREPKEMRTLPLLMISLSEECLHLLSEMYWAQGPRIHSTLPPVPTGDRGAPIPRFDRQNSLSAPGGYKPKMGPGGTLDPC